MAQEKPDFNTWGVGQLSHPWRPMRSEHAAGAYTAGLRPRTPLGRRSGTVYRFRGILTMPQPDAPNGSSSDSKTADPLATIGSRQDTIDVKISHRIIELFSDGLYSSPNKAVEELVSNSFDAGAQNVHVILAPDLKADDASVAVLDDGEGMDAERLKQHWIIGRSSRRRKGASGDRKPIGRFGIGKLATYVLARKLTHVCKFGGTYYAATMDYNALDAGKEPGVEGVFTEEKIEIPLRTLSEEEAKKLLSVWLKGSKPGYKKVRLFGRQSTKSWTVAIMSNLTEMGTKIQRGRLRWILRTAMPLRDDFQLYLDGDRIEPSKIDRPKIDQWTIGETLLPDDLGKPCPDGLEPTEDETVSGKDPQRFGLSHDRLGRITGVAELYEDELVGGKSAVIERSHGFFVYVRGRLINADDPGFGIERNLLRHGTFSRLRVVAHIDGLDAALRSSRESIQEGEPLNLSKNFLHAVFNKARTRLVEHEKATDPGARLKGRLSSVPGSLTRRPLLALAILAVEGTQHPTYVKVPEGLLDQTRADLINKLKERRESESGVFESTVLTELDPREGIAIYYVEEGVLKINTSHPFVEAFQDQYTNLDSLRPLEMYAASEVLTEAYLYQLDVAEDVIHEVLSRRDELLRELVRTSARRTPGMLASALIDAKDDEDRLEDEVRASIDAMGFADVVDLTGKGKPDGTTARPPWCPRTKKRIRDMPGYTEICRDIVGCAPGVSAQ